MEIKWKLLCSIMGLGLRVKHLGLSLNNLYIREPTLKLAKDHQVDGEELLRHDSPPKPRCDGLLVEPRQTRSEKRKNTA